MPDNKTPGNEADNNLTHGNENDDHERRDRRSTSALEKGLLVLEAIAGRMQSVGLPDLTAQLGLPRQTVHRVLQQLESAGMILREPTRDRFSVGPRLSRLALEALSSSNQTAAVRAIMTDLVRDVEESCNVGVLDGMQFHYLERVDCRWALRVNLQAGDRVPAYCTSGGKVMLAHLPAARCSRLLKVSDLKPHTDYTLTTPDALSDEFATIRRQGYALNNQEFAIGIVGVAVPIVDGENRALAALAFHGPIPRFSVERAKQVVPKLQEAARQLGKVWGLDDPVESEP